MLILITYGENLKGNKYHGGNSKMVFIPKKLTFDALLVMVHEIIRANPNKFVCELRSSFNTDCRVARSKIKKMIKIYILC